MNRMLSDATLRDQVDYTRRVIRAFIPERLSGLDLSLTVGLSARGGPPLQ